jgi:hypothetical protein
MAVRDVDGCVCKSGQGDRSKHTRQEQRKLVGRILLPYPPSNRHTRSLT